MGKQINKLSVLLILSYFEISQVIAQAKTRVLHYRNNNYTFNSYHIENFNIITIEGSQGIQINVTPAHNITRDVYVDLEVLMKPLNADKFQSILNFKLNCCVLLKRSSGLGSFGIVKKWLNNMLNSGTVPLSCPVLKYNYSWTIVPRKKNGVPVLQVEGFYRVLLNLYLKRSRRIERLLNVNTLTELSFQ